MSDLVNFYLRTAEGKPNGQVFHGIACIHFVLEKKLAAYLQKYELSVTTFNALMLIKHKGQNTGITQTTLVQQLVESPSNITRLVDKLIKEGLAKRQMSETDRRSNFITITPKGSKHLDDLWPGYCQLVRSLTGELLNENNIQTLAKIFNLWLEKLEEIK